MTPGRDTHGDQPAGYGCAADNQDHNNGMARLIGCFGKSMHVQGMRKPEKKSSLLICKWLRDDKTLAPKVANTKFHMTTSKVYNKSFSRHQKSFEISIDSKIFAQNISVHLFAYVCLKICFLILLALTSCKFSCSLFYLRLVVGANSFRGLQNF